MRAQAAAAESVSYQISRRWMALGSVGVRRLDDEIRSSPIVDQEFEFGGFAGFAYQLGHV
jgi:outer membrane scaffolding protein for murein synthesis (MipA/OmpV family)